MTTSQQERLENILRLIDCVVNRPTEKELADKELQKLLKNNAQTLKENIEQVIREDDGIFAHSMIGTYHFGFRELLTNYGNKKI